MKDWKTFFIVRLADSGHFTPEIHSRRNGLDLLLFKCNEIVNRTTIQIGILENGYLITFEIHNPRTPGFSEQQKREHLYRYSFHPTDRYGDPGLEFIAMNTDHFDKLLREGPKGKEVQYFKNGRIVKSEVFQFYADNSDCNFPTTIEFVKKSLLDRVLNLFKSEAARYDDRKEIELREIFAGGI